MNTQTQVRICGVDLAATIYYQPSESPLGDYPGCTEEFIVEKLETPDGLDLVQFIDEVLGMDTERLSEYVKAKLKAGMERNAA
jgi:hypothetical protein